MNLRPNCRSTRSCGDCRGLEPGNRVRLQLDPWDSPIHSLEQEVAYGNEGILVRLRRPKRFWPVDEFRIKVDQCRSRAGVDKRGLKFDLEIIGSSGCPPGQHLTQLYFPRYRT